MSHVWISGAHPDYDGEVWTLPVPNIMFICKYCAEEMAFLLLKLVFMLWFQQSLVFYLIHVSPGLAENVFFLNYLHDAEKLGHRGSANFLAQRHTFTQ